MSQLTIFYDGTCPLCAKEMRSLKEHDAKGLLKTVDIYSDEFSHFPEINPDEANRILHAIDSKGQLILGLDAAHKAWTLVGKGKLYAPLRWRLVKPVADTFYLFFAKHRYRISYLLTGKSRCKSCQLK